MKQKMSKQWTLTTKPNEEDANLGLSGNDELSVDNDDEAAEIETAKVEPGKQVKLKQ